ncbi:unnamed protein product [Prorocentrum cordatum]|uniref:AAA+ ATPase domain-containing protein n=1 Tax=Prorocentrum cordatum TaxID=2364126 RepID=A0ABN9SHA3_9DINO|nr:unnamed protein product [Polarella glacialis]
MRARGWYVPADLEPSRFPGLRIQSTEVLAEPFVFSKASSNRLKNRPPDGRSWLAAYVGRPDASEAEGIEYAESLLDEPFDGLCTHLIPRKKHRIAPIGAGAGLAAPNVQLTVPGSLGVIVGPAGSGKSSFARFWLGMPARAEWGSVLSHFQSPDAATAALSAAALSTSTATAPHAQLSRGEQSRADVARALAALAQGLKPEALSRPMCPEARTPALVLEEFTSLLDRATAQRVAAGVSRFLRALPAASGRPALVVVTCHEDLVGAGRLEPDWVFETRPGKLSLLRPASPPGPLPGDSDTPAGEGARLRGVATPCRTPSPDEDAAAAALASAAAAAAPPPIGKATPTGPSAAQASAAAPGPTDWLAAPLCLERVRLEVRRALPCEWAHFREHHYKDHTLVASAVGWVGLLAGRPVGCTFAVNLAPNYVANGRLDRCPQRSFQKRTAVENEERWLALPLSWARRPGAREHRTVVHPDFQGCSLGSALSDAVAREHELQGWLFASKTAHPHFGSYRDRSPFWAPCPNNGVAPKSGAAASFHHFWVGAVRPDGTTDPEREGKLAARMVDGRIRAAGGA